MTYLLNLPSASLRKMNIAFDPTWAIYNPCVMVRDSEIFSSFRVSTATVCPHHTGWIKPPHTKLDNETVIARLNRDLLVEEQTLVDTKGFCAKTRPDIHYGFEDVRLIPSQEEPGKTIVLGCTPLPRQEGSRISKLVCGPDFQIESIVTYRSPFGRAVEKNWIPFYRDGVLHIIYQWNPLIVLRLHEDGTTSLVKWFDRNDLLVGYRGSSQAIETARGWAFVLHRRVFTGFNDFAHYQLHRILEIDRDFKPIRISDDFKFITDDIEYCAGWARWEGRILCSFGMNDSHAYLLSLAEAEVENLLQPLPEGAFTARAVSPEVYRGVVEMLLEMKTPSEREKLLYHIETIRGFDKRPLLRFFPYSKTKILLKTVWALVVNYFSPKRSPIVLIRHPRDD